MVEIFMKSLIIIFILLNVVLWGQTESTIKKSGIVPIFYYDALNYRSTQPGKTRLDFYFEVPYKSIQFVKSEDGFTAHYSITVSVFDESNEKLISEKTWNEKMFAKDFETTLQDNYYLSTKSFDLVPNNYSIRCEVEDNESKKNYIHNDKITVKDLSKPLSVSDLMLIDRQIEVEGKTRYIPNITRNVANQSEGLKVYFEVYSDSAQKVYLDYTITTVYSMSVEEKDKIFETIDSIGLHKSINQIYTFLHNAQLSMGQYKLNLNINDINKEDVVSASKTFISRWVGMPSSIVDLDKAVGQMVYIAKPAELDYIKDAKDRDEKLKRFLAFWKAKDPTPNTEENEVFEEYYRRIEYANEHFKHYIEGWRTDMGMVYITLGPPNNVERHPFEYDSKPYEVWEYYDLNRQFVFIDETGFGDYRLLNPEYGSWWRYRQ
jgi:GWxTD domain-containing protein